MAVPPPTPDKYLDNIIWLEKEDDLIKFFKVKILLSFILASLMKIIFPFFLPPHARLTKNLSKARNSVTASEGHAELEAHQTQASIFHFEPKW